MESKALNVNFTTLRKKILALKVLNTKSLLIMKFTAIILLSACLSASASGFSQNVTLSEKNVSMEKVFNEIRKQTGYVFFFDEAWIQRAGKVSIEVKNVPLEKALQICFKDQPLSYTIIEKTIVLKMKNVSGNSMQFKEDELPPPIDIKGRIVDESGEPVIASVIVKGGTKGVSSNIQGAFELSDIDENAVLVISGVNIETRELRINGKADLGTIVVKRRVEENEIVSVSTGYQRIPKERAAGSFSIIGQELIEKRVGLNVLQRMEDYVPGLIFQRDENLGPTSEKTNITIRGTSTIFSENQPLIVVDNFPYDGDIKNINPNDVKSITILKDATAASIWGARAGNGVIIIETKTGSFNSKTQVIANINFSIGEKLDAFQHPQMTVPEYVDVVTNLFDQGFFQTLAASNTTAIQPLIQTLINRRDGIITPQEATQQINYYKQQDIRREFEKHYYQNALNKQVSINLTGGGSIHHYSLNAGFDDSETGIVANTYKRLTLDLKNTWKLLNDRLIINSNLNYINSVKNTGNLHMTSWENRNSLFPYSQLADENGNSLPIAVYNKNFINDAMNNGLLDWNMYPLDEIGLSPDIIKSADYRLMAGITYKVIPGLTVDALYQYWHNLTDGEQQLSKRSYRLRDMINTFTQVNPDGSFSYPIPNGDLLLTNNSRSYSHNARGQVNYNKVFNGRHHIVALAGAEVRDFQQEGYSGGYYGYNDDLGISVPVDHVNTYTSYITNLNNRLIPDFGSHSGSVNRFHSMYANASYTFDNRFTITGSARRDASNIFGVETNNRVKPLWSAGLSWELSKESFYKSDLIPYLKLRTSFGYNGNVNNTIAALLTAQYRESRINLLVSGINEPYVVITNPPNPNLRWEKVEIINMALDFASKNKRLQGSIDYYIKRGIDLIGSEFFPPSSGISSFKGNFANTRTNGVDMDLSSQNTTGLLKWSTDLNVSLVNDKVTHYGTDHTATQARGYGLGQRIFDPIPVVGRPLFSVYSYHWAGLDPATGDPMGYIDGIASTDHNNIMRGYLKAEDMKYHGPGRPPVFGALRNSLRYKDFSLSVNVSFRLGYYFRMPFLSYTSLTNASNISIISDEFGLRWQKPGDETFTDIPSFRPTLTGGVANNRNTFYNYSEARVEKGDHIRLQDIMLSYSLIKKPWLPIKEAQVYVHANNLGILWKATDKVKDPDYRTFFAPARSLSAGIRVNF